MSQRTKLERGRRRPRPTVTDGAAD
jgi:hypothetical protein